MKMNTLENARILTRPFLTGSLCVSDKDGLI